LREAAVYVKRLAEGGTYYTFFGPSPNTRFPGAEREQGSET